MTTKREARAQRGQRAHHPRDAAIADLLTGIDRRNAVRKTHRRYSDRHDRPDLRSLALCTAIAGPIYGTAHLTSNEDDVTCGRCRRILAGSERAKAQYGAK